MSSSSAFGKVTSLVVASSSTGGILLARLYEPDLASERGPLLEALLEAARAEGALGLGQ